MSNKDDAAWDVEKLWLDFQMGLDNKRKYPIQQFKAYAQAVSRYLDLTRNGPLFHKKVVRKVNGLTDSLSLERKRVPDAVLMEARRLECSTFAGCDPHFVGDEPPGL